MNGVGDGAEQMMKFETRPISDSRVDLLTKLLTVFAQLSIVTYDWTDIIRLAKGPLIATHCSHANVVCLSLIAIKPKY